VSTLAFIFPGQGSQFVGMGQAFLETVPQASEIFDVGEKVTGLPLRHLSLEGPSSDLTRTSNLQPALTAVDLVCCIAAQAAGLEPASVAGHSLGEYPALWAAGVLTLENTFRLVEARGRLMEGTGQERPGAMAAIIGLSKDALEALIVPLAEQGTLALANHNSPEQIVVTGEKRLVDDLCAAAKESGARAVPLKVAGAYHSPLMAEAAHEFTTVLADVPFASPRIPIYSNVTARTETDPRRIRQLMAEQICAPVRWYETVVNMQRDGATAFLELGPKKVLSTLVSKSLPGGAVLVLQAEDPAGLRSAIEALERMFTP
jgi:[acyl-carrier-protein] S-malonyltransferase